VSVTVTGRPGSDLSTLTFAIHAIRQLIYLSPGQGLRAESGLVPVLDKRLDRLHVCAPELNISAPVCED